MIARRLEADGGICEQPGTAVVITGLECSAANPHHLTSRSGMAFVDVGLVIRRLLAAVAPGALGPWWLRSGLNVRLFTAIVPAAAHSGQVGRVHRVTVTTVAGNGRNSGVELMELERKDD